MSERGELAMGMSIADVLLAHRVAKGGRCSCGAYLSDDRPSTLAQHGEASLVAAGFGRVRAPLPAPESLAEAWLAGKDSHRLAPNPYWTE